MKYLLFAGHQHYPLGGIADLQATGETVEELKLYFVEKATEIADGSYIDNWCQIVEKETLTCVLTGHLDHKEGDYDEPGEPSWWDSD